MIEPSLVESEIDEVMLRMKTFYQPEEIASKGYAEDRLHSAHLYAYHCTHEELTNMLSECNLLLKAIDDDLLKYLADSKEVFNEYKSKIKIIGRFETMIRPQGFENTNFASN